MKEVVGNEKIFENRNYLDYKSLHKDLFTTEVGYLFSKNKVNIQIPTSIYLSIINSYLFELFDKNIDLNSITLLSYEFNIRYQSLQEENYIKKVYLIPRVKEVIKDKYTNQVNEIELELCPINMQDVKVKYM